MSDKNRQRYDHTSTDRAAAHLKRLATNQGKRLPVDLFKEHVRQIDDLIRAEYASSAAGVIRKAIEEAHSRLKK